jgi:Lipocalin-like domain
MCLLMRATNGPSYSKYSPEMLGHDRFWQDARFLARRHGAKILAEGGFMNRRQMIGAIGLAAALQAAPARDRFIGVWSLVSCERRYKDGRIDYPYGEKPVGRITYDKAGRMSAQLMRPGRRSTVTPGLPLTGNASTEEILDAVNGFTAYFGTFDIDESAQMVIHHVQACLVPSWQGIVRGHS